MQLLKDIRARAEESDSGSLWRYLQDQEANGAGEFIAWESGLHDPNVRPLWRLNGWATWTSWHLGVGINTEAGHSGRYPMAHRAEFVVTVGPWSIYLARLWPAKAGR